MIYDNTLEDNPIKSIDAIGNLGYNVPEANTIAQIILKMEEKGMDRKYLKRDLDVMLKIIRSYSESTTDKVTDIIQSEKELIKVEQMLKGDPTEQEFLKMLDQEFPTTT